MQRQLQRQVHRHRSPVQLGGLHTARSPSSSDRRKPSIPGGPLHNERARGSRCWSDAMPQRVPRSSSAGGQNAEKSCARSRRWLPAPSPWQKAAAAGAASRAAARRPLHRASTPVSHPALALDPPSPGYPAYRSLSSRTLADRRYFRCETPRLFSFFLFLFATRARSVTTESNRFDRKLVDLRWPACARRACCGPATRRARPTMCVCVCVLCVCARARARDPTRPRARMRGVSPMMLCAGAHIALEQQDWNRWHEPMP